MTDPFDLQRFVTAQEQTYDTAVRELRRGRKTSHWMWFVFPQVRGLGRSGTAQHFGISGREEARAYLDHPVLGTRLRECAQILLDGAVAATAAGRRPDAEAVLGHIDAMKLRSSMTLFDQVGHEGDPFPAVLEHYFDGDRDPATLDRLGA